MFIPLLIGLCVSLLAYLPVRVVSERVGLVVQPRADRWHRRPTPVLGGVQMFVGFLAGVVWLGVSGHALPWGLLAGSLMAFLIGLYDDLRELSPPTKLTLQILAAILVISQDFYIHAFFAWDVANILLSLLWLVGITNAINLIDNMDGLAGGVSLIVTGFLAYVLAKQGAMTYVGLLGALAGAILGFLVFNFPPASIFMGDGGSLFLGFTLATITVVRRPQASNVFAIMGVPTLLFLLPIADTLLVTITRLMRGQSPAQGGRDHTSHRLVAFGLSERRAVLVLYAIALLSGVSSAVLEALDYDLSLVLVPLLIIGMAILAAYLARLRVTGAESDAPQGTLVRLMLDLTYRRRLLDVLLDALIISLAYYLAFWITAGLQVGGAVLTVYVRTLPVALGAAYLGLVLTNVYRERWQFVGLPALLRHGRAALVAGVVAAVGVRLVRPDFDRWAVFLLFAVFLFLGISGARASFRILDSLYRQQTVLERGEPVVILGADEQGLAVLTWLLAQPTLGWRPVGFLDRDPYLWNGLVQGLPVLGGVEALPALCAGRDLRGVILPPEVQLSPEEQQTLRRLSRQCGLWVRRCTIMFEDL